MKHSSVSLIIVNLNGFEHLPALFDSIRALRFPPELIETVVIDNGSTDGSVQWLRKEWPNVRIIGNARNVGFASACNQGASIAIGEWLAFVNNDMRLDPDWLANLFHALEESGKDTVCAGSKILSWDGTRIDFIGGLLTFYGHSFQKNLGAAVEDADSGGRPQKTLFVCGGALLIKKDIFIKVGGFDDDYFAYFEDVDLGWRLWVLGYEVIFAPSAVAFHKGFSTMRKYPASRHVCLCERNALFTVYKNYSDENLQKVLPAAIILLVQRALLHTSAAPSDPSMIMGSPESGHHDQPPGESKLAGMSKMLKELGVRETIKRARLSVAIKVLRKNGMHPIAEEGIGILSAIPQLISSLERLNRKRDLVQFNRKRSDGEIFSLFGEPLKPFPDTPDFERFTRLVSENFEIDKMFEPERHGALKGEN